MRTEDTQTLTRAELEAILEAQEARHFERLRRKASRSGVWVLAFVALPVLFVLLSLLLERQLPRPVLVVTMVSISCVGIFSFVKGREEAARQLASELAQKQRSLQRVE